MLLEDDGIEFRNGDEKEFDVVAAGDVLQLTDRANVLQRDRLWAVGTHLALPVQESESVPDPQKVWEQFSFQIGVVSELLRDLAFFLELLPKGQFLTVWPQLLLQEAG